MAFVERFVFGRIRCVDGITVESERDGISLADDRFEVLRCDVVVVVVRPPAVTAPFVELSTGLRILSALGEGVENRDAVDRDSDGTDQGQVTGLL